MSTELVMLVRAHGANGAKVLITMDPVTQAVLWAEKFNNDLRLSIQDGIDNDMYALYGGEGNTASDRVNQLLGATPDHKAVFILGGMYWAYSGTPATVSLTLKLVTFDPPPSPGTWGAVTVVASVTRAADPINPTTGNFTKLIGSDGTTAYVLAPDPDPAKGSVIYRLSLDGTTEMVVCPTTFVRSPAADNPGDGDIAAMLVITGGVHSLAFGRTHPV